MPNRFQKSQHDLAYEFIARRDGEYCLPCFIETGIKVGPPQIKLQIDHADSNPQNWSSPNLTLDCAKHNIRFRNMPREEHLRLIQKYSAKNEVARARENHFIPTILSKDQVDYSNGSPELQLNSIFEKKWLDFMHGWIGANGSIPKDEAIYGGAAVAGCNPTTSERYLRKYTSSMGCFTKDRDSSGSKIIKYRDTPK
jgi:hypothetical protein